MSKRDQAIADFVIKKLRHDDRWALRALTIVAHNQTAHEYNTEHTDQNNNVGFNGTDAKKLTGIHKFYENRVEWAKRRNLSEKDVSITEAQMKVIHRRIPKYWRQIIATSNMERLQKMVAEAEIAEMNKIPDEKLPLHLVDEWTFEETKVAFLNRLKNDELMLCV